MSATLQTLSDRVRYRQELPPPSARRMLRQAAGVSLQDIADVVGVTRQAVATWEDGRTPRGQSLPRYLEVIETLRRAIAAAPPQSESPPGRALEALARTPMDKATTGSGADWMRQLPTRRARARRRPPVSRWLARREGELERGFRRAVELDDARDDCRAAA